MKDSNHGYTTTIILLENYCSIWLHPNKQNGFNGLSMYAWFSWLKVTFIVWFHFFQQTENKEEPDRLFKKNIQHSEQRK